MCRRSAMLSAATVANPVTCAAKVVGATTVATIAVGAAMSAHHANSSRAPRAASARRVATSCAPRADMSSVVTDSDAPPFIATVASVAKSSAKISGATTTGATAARAPCRRVSSSVSCVSVPCRHVSCSARCRAVSLRIGEWRYDCSDLPKESVAVANAMECHHTLLPQESRRREQSPFDDCVAVLSGKVTLSPEVTGQAADARRIVDLLSYKHTRGACK